MAKRDLKKELAPLYSPSSREVTEVDVGAMDFLMIDGEGDPNTSPQYAAAVETLFGVAYAIKFGIKRGPLGIDYGVMPLEGLWWSEDLDAFVTGDKAAWKWTMMIAQPEFVDSAAVAAGIEAAAKKGLRAIDELRFETFEEGLSAQIMHIGPFSEEGPTIERVHDYIARSGRDRRGRHHEIYLSDIRKAAPEKWRTIVRQPMR